VVGVLEVLQQHLSHCSREIQTKGLVND
jgi:hypothetical protein